MSYSTSDCYPPTHFNLSFNSSILSFNLLRVAKESSSDSFNYYRSSNSNASHYLWGLIGDPLLTKVNSALSFLISASFSLSKLFTTFKPDNFPRRFPLSPCNLITLSWRVELVAISYKISVSLLPPFSFCSLSCVLYFTLVLFNFSSSSSIFDFNSSMSLLHCSCN